MRRTLYIFLPILCLILASGTPRNTIQDKALALVTNPLLKNASVGILAVTASGDTLACFDCDRLLLPASNLKLVTTGLAMHSLGADYRYSTKIGYTGKIENGVLSGDLYIIGGGDPTTASRNPIARPINEIFEKWKDCIEKAGIKRIKGRIIGDARCFEPMPEHETWQYADIGTYYGCGVSGLSYFENEIQFKVSPGEKVGDPVIISQLYPMTPWMTIGQDTRTGKPGTPNTLYLYTTDLAPDALWRGSFPLGRSPKIEDAANKFPSYTCAWHFTEYLKNCGIICDGGPLQCCGPLSPEDPATPEKLRTPVAPAEKISIIGETLSPRMSDIAGVTNRDSNNLYAETLMKTLGMEYCGSGCYDSSYVAVERLFDEIGMNPGTSHKIYDGSGLSRQNLVSASFFCEFLLRMMDSPCFGDYIEAIGHPGGEGTMKSMLASLPEETRERIRIKSGSMTGVRCFSGYIIPESGSREDTIVFSIMTNNFNCPISKIQPLIDSLISEIACIGICKK